MTLFALRLRNSDVESPRAMANASQSDTSARVANRLNRSVLPAWEGFVTSSLDQTCIPLFLVFQSAVTVTLPPNRTAVLEASTTKRKNCIGTGGWTCFRDQVDREAACQ